MSGSQWGAGAFCERLPAIIDRDADAVLAGADSCWRGLWAPTGSGSADGTASDNRTGSGSVPIRSIRPGPAAPNSAPASMRRTEHRCVARAIHAIDGRPLRSVRRRPADPLRPADPKQVRLSNLTLVGSGWIGRLARHREGEKWLRGDLADGPRTKAECERAALEAGFFESILLRARIDLAVRCVRSAFSMSACCHWSLSGTAIESPEST
jgi:hypothetical protein